MIEKRVLDYLQSSLIADVFFETPVNPPSEFVVLEKTGSNDNNGLLTATIAVQSVSNSLYRAALLNEKAKAAMKKFDKETNIFRSECDSDYNFTDTSTKRYRYQAVFTIVYKEDETW